MAVSGASGPTLNVNTPQGNPATIYNASNQRTDSGQGYNVAGNVTAMNTFSNLTYDAENRLLTASSPTPYTYAYDGNGRRVMKTGAGNTTIYVYGVAGQLAAEYDSALTGAEPCSTCYLRPTKGAGWATSCVPIGFLESEVRTTHGESACFKRPGPRVRLYAR